jgi:phenylacetic acid degradation operon negative regulatory protein
MTRIDKWIAAHLRAAAPRARSLIVTMFGDSVAPYSDGVWLSDLIDLLKPFEVNERLVRTSVFRLSEDGWLTPKRDGRRSYYTLAAAGRRRFQHAYDRVYTAPLSWNGDWTLVIQPKQTNSADDRARLSRELEWEGFGFIAPGIYLKPAADVAGLREILHDMKLEQRAFVMQARDGALVASRPVDALMSQCWDLQGVSNSYKTFVDRFESLQALIGEGSLTPERAFIVQTLLIDSFRRLTLHDPRLPAELLPKDWPGHRAHELCRRIYKHTYRSVREYLLPRFGISSGALPKPPNELLRRFGGLE